MSRRLLSLVLLSILLLSSVAPRSAAEAVPNAGPVSFRSSPVMFVENVGQWDTSAAFQLCSRNGTLWLAEDALWVTVSERPAANGQDPRVATLAGLRQGPANEPHKAASVKLSFVGANPHPRLEPFDRLDTVISYFLGSDPAGWRPDVPVWGGLRYVDLYPGIDLELTSAGGQLVLRLAARPDADQAVVRLRVEGAQAVAADGAALQLRTAAGTFALRLIQTLGTKGLAPSVQLHSAGAFDVLAPFASMNPDVLPAVENLQSTAGNPTDLLYSTFLGGDGSDSGRSIAVDGTGSAYVIGLTNSANFPTTPGAFDTDHNGESFDAFVARLNPAGSALVYATFLGGTGYDAGYGIAVDGTGSPFMTGDTRSIGFPTTSGAFDTGHNGSYDVFVTRLTTTRFHTYLPIVLK